MRNKILFIGVGGAGSIMADKAMRDYPELFDSVAIDCGINRELPCHQLSDTLMMNQQGFTTKKENVETLINENINEIKYIFDRYQNDRLDDIEFICHAIRE